MLHFPLHRLLVFGGVSVSGRRRWLENHGQHASPKFKSDKETILYGLPAPEGQSAKFVRPGMS